MKIFVSYSRRDADFAQQIDEEFQGSRHNVFTDVKDIQVGVVWTSAIETNISNCDIFVVIVTDAALRSHYVENEVLQAQRENKKIIPCIFKNINLNEIKWGLEKIQGLKFGDKYELARDLYSKIKNYENKIPVDDVSESFSKSIETTTTAVTPPTTSDTHRLQQQKDLRQPPKENTDVKKQAVSFMNEKDNLLDGITLNASLLIIGGLILLYTGVTILFNYIIIDPLTNITPDTISNSTTTFSNYKVKEISPLTFLLLGPLGIISLIVSLGLLKKKNGLVQLHP